MLNRYLLAPLAAALLPAAPRRTYAQIGGVGTGPTGPAAPAAPAAPGLVGSGEGRLPRQTSTPPAARGGKRAAGARSFRFLLAGLWLALLPLLAHAGTPVLTLQATVAAGTGVDATAFVDQVEIVNFSTGAVVASAVPNGGFETPAQAAGGFAYTPTGASWTFASNAGVARPGGGFAPPSPSPEGNQVAFLQTNGSGAGSISQTLPSLAAGTYQLRVQLAQRGSNTTAQSVRVLIDGAVIGTFTPASSTAYASYLSTAFVVDAVLRLEALGSASLGTATDVTAFVDQVELLNVGAGTSAAVPNAGFETSSSLANGDYGYIPAGASWAFAGNSGIATNGSAFGNPAAPGPTRVAFLQSKSDGSGIFSQVLPTALVAGSYRVRLYGAQRGTAPADQGVRVLLNGQEVGRFQPTAAFGQYTLPSASTSFALGTLPPLSTLPTLTAVSPFIGVPGTVLTLTGTNLAGTTSIAFAGGAGAKVVSSGFAVNAAGTAITGVVVPAGAQSGPVTASVANGPSAAGPALFTRAITLTARGSNTAAVKADGTLWAWGVNRYGQLGTNGTTTSLVPVQVGTATNWASVAAGTFHTVAVRTDGTLWAWGTNNDGQLGINSTTDSPVPVQVGTATNWVSVAAGNAHTVAVRADGTLWAWGNNFEGQLGYAGSVPSGFYGYAGNLVPAQVGTATNWVSAAAGDRHTVAVQADGTLWGWGDNSSGQLGTTGRGGLVPAQTGTATNWVSATAGGSHTVAVRTDGTLWAWGTNYNGQLGNGSTTGSRVPTQVGTATNWASAAAGYARTVAVRADGTFWAWGRNDNREMSNSSTMNSPVPVQVGTATSWASAAAGSNHMAGEQSCRAVWAWGSNNYGQVGDGSTTDVPVPVLVVNPVSLLRFAPASAGVGSTVAVTGTGLLGLTVLSVNGVDALASVTGLTDTGFSFVVPATATPTATGTVSVASGCGAASSTGFMVAPAVTAVSPFLGVPGTVLTLTGTNLAGTTSIAFAGGAGVKVVSSGFAVNAAGTSITGVVVPAGAQSGPVTAIVANGPSAAGPALFTRARALAGGTYHTVAVRADGTLWAWGLNQYGQLGTNGTTNSLVPVQVGTATNWASVSAGTYHTVAVRADGTLWGWGYNGVGQLGINSTTNTPVPVQVGTATTWASVATGGTHTVAVRADGTLWAWGANSSGQLGNNTTTTSLVPGQVGTATNWASAAAGTTHTVAVQADGTLWAWGLNSGGQLGNNSTTNSRVPVQVGAATTWVSAVGGRSYTVAVQADGTLWTWGNNGNGQTSRVPVPVGTATNWASAAAGTTHTVAVQADGTLWAWGSNSSGQLGNNTTTSSTVPVQVGTATTWVNAAAGGNQTVGEQSCRSVWAWGSNNSGQVGDGSTTDSSVPLLVVNPVSLLSFAPASAAVGSTVAVTGTGLLGLTALSVNGADALASVTGLTDTGFSFVVPATALATGTTTVAAGCGTASSPDLVVTPPPALTLTAVSTAAELPGMPVTLTGTGFTSGSTVSFGGVAAAGVTYLSPTSLTAVVPVGAAAGSSAVVVSSNGNSSPAGPAFEVLRVYRDAAASGCLSTAPLTLSGTGGAGAWRYLRLPGAGGAVVAAIEDTRDLGTVAAGFTALGTATASPVRVDGRAGRRYLDRNFYLTATNQTFPGQTVRVRFFGLKSELDRLTAVDANATAATLKASQYSGANEDCDLADNSAAGERRLLAAPATVLAGTDWFTAELTVADHFSEFYLTGASTPLPVELTAFTATVDGPTAVRLAWATATEKNSQAFEVERSADGTAFARIGTVPAAGSSSAPRAYELLDRQLPAGAATLYYRLKQVDLDGTFSYSPVRTVALTGAAEGLSLFPNPTHGAATLTGVAPGAAVTVLDALGRPVLTATADAAGTAALVLPAGLPTGVYVVRTGSRALRLTVE